MKHDVNCVENEILSFIIFILFCQWKIIESQEISLESLLVISSNLVFIPNILVANFIIFFSNILILVIVNTGRWQHKINLVYFPHFFAEQLNWKKKLSLTILRKHNENCIIFWLKYIRHSIDIMYDTYILYRICSLVKKKNRE